MTIKPTKFCILSTITFTYGLFIFYLSSLSFPPAPPDLGFLYAFAYQLEDWGLSFLIYPFYVAYRYPDKFAHFVLYFGLGLLLKPTLSSSSNGVVSKYAVPFSIAIGTLYGATDEFHQSFVPYRSASSMDLYADFLGLLFAQILILFHLNVKKLVKWAKVKRR